MSSADGDPRTDLARSIVIYTGILLLTLAAVVSAVGILNRELFSAQAFVRLYLQALSDHDIDAALATPGVTLATDDEPGTGEAALLVPDALSDLSAIALVSDTEIVPGRHRIVYSYTLTGLDEHTATAKSEFDVVQTGTSWLFFPEWQFVRPPTAHAEITVSHAAEFTAGTVAVATDDPSAFHASGDYEVLVPSLTVLSHDSYYLGSRSVSLLATGARTSVSAIVDVQATTLFLSTVQTAVDDFLDDCAAQRLLYPPGCPFGLDVNDRIASDPAWSIETYPDLTILAGQSSWVVPSASGSARIAVDIRSLFDGTVSKRGESVPFTVTFTVTIAPDGTLTFAPRG